MTATEVTISNLETQLVELYQEKDFLNRELGVSSAAEVVELAKNLRAKYDQRLGNGILGKSIKEADKMIASLEEQLVDLYQEKDLLNQELGVSSAMEVVELVKSLNAAGSASETVCEITHPSEEMIMNLESQLIDLYQEKDQLNQSLGVSSSAEVVRIVDRLVDLLKEICFQNFIHHKDNSPPNKLHSYINHSIKDLIQQLPVFNNKHSM